MTKIVAVVARACRSRSLHRLVHAYLAIPPGTNPQFVKVFTPLPLGADSVGLEVWARLDYMGMATPDNGQAMKVHVLGSSTSGPGDRARCELCTSPHSIQDSPAYSETSDLKSYGNTHPFEMLIYQSQHQARWRCQ